MDFSMLKNILFLDIETVPLHQDFNGLNERLQKLWIKKAQRIAPEADAEPAELFAERAGIFAEFGKVVAISVGVFAQVKGEEPKFRIKALASHDEKELLLEFNDLLKKFPPHQLWLCAHNGKEFDYPFLCRRMLIHGIPLPEVLNIGGKKPWEVRHFDTLQMWKFGDYKNYTSLDLLAAVFDVPTSKSDMDGSMVGQAYYKDNDLEAISEYCSQDVVVLARVFQKMNGMETVPNEQLIFV